MLLDQVVAVVVHDLRGHGVHADGVGEAPFQEIHYRAAVVVAGVLVCKLCSEEVPGGLNEALASEHDAGEVRGLGKLARADRYELV